MQRSMLRIASSLFGFILCNTAVAAFAQTPQPTPTRTFGAMHQISEASGSAYVTSLPSGADLWVDGVHVGSTPMLLGALYRGRHTLTLAKSGWATQDVTFRVVPNTVALQNHYLIRLKSAGPGRDGAAMFHCVAGARIRVDGVEVSDPTHVQVLRAGQHVVSVQQGNSQFRRDFDIVPEMTTDVILRDVPAARIPSVVAAVSSEIPSSDITIQHLKVIVRYRGHIAVGHLGDPNMRIDTQTVQVDPAPVLLDGQLYLPVDVISMLTGQP